MGETILLTCLVAAPGWPDVGSREVNRGNLLETVSYLESLGERSTWENQNRAVRWVRERMAAYGVEPIEDEYEFGGERWSNAVGKIRGNGKSEEAILLLAHVDSISHSGKAPGADDNGGGVAVALETARLLSTALLDRTILLCFFTNEERGQLGSRSFVEKIKSHDLAVSAVINLDVLGYNQPSLFDWQAIRAQASLKYKTKAFLRIVKNGMRGWREGKDVIEVAGREKNRGLAEAVAKSMQIDGGIKAKEHIGDDCG